MHILEHFELLADFGLKIIPLRHNSKAPLFKNWNTKWNKKNILQKIQRFPNSNLGLLLGEIIDVEGDSEEANNFINDLIGNYRHPVYSSKKSTHHLFLTPSHNLRRLQVNQIEFRGYGHQSVLPPSKINDVEYKWRADFYLPVPPMPKNLLDFFNSNFKKSKNKFLIKPGHVKTKCFLCEKNNFLDKKRYNLELQVFKILGQRWQCIKCRAIKTQAACRLIRAGISDLESIKSVT
jgi:hypothetical protein